MFFYIALHRDSRTAMLAGPYPDEESANAARQKALDKANEVDPWAWFDRSSLAKSEKEIKTNFGII